VLVKKNSLRIHSIKQVLCVSPVRAHTVRNGVKRGKREENIHINGNKEIRWT